MALVEAKCVWTGVTGLPGVNTWYFDDTVSLTGMASWLHTFYNDLAGYLPPGVTVQVPDTGNIVDTATGVLTGLWNTGTTTAAVTGSGSNAFAAGVGACVTWKTATVVNGRLVHGRTFIVPLMSGCYAADGTLTTTFMGDIASRITTFLSSAGGKFRAWHRPVAGAGGAAAQVLSGSCPDQATRLVTRRR